VVVIGYRFGGDCMPGELAMAVSQVNLMESGNLDHELGSPAESLGAMQVASPAAGEPLHRLALVRRQQGVALRTVARCLGVSVEEAARQEQPGADLSISTLLQWQQVLEVPVAELLVESQDELSEAVLERARLIKVMKTAMSILEKADNSRVRRLTETLVAQLVEIMPELEGVSPWHELTTPRRRRDDLGRIAERQIPARLGRDLESGEHAA
jgi:transcriptional regulator with XRE-family HTH domain